MAYKILINKSGSDLEITLMTRKGSDPKDEGAPVSLSLKEGEKQRIEYGDDQNPFLNGITIAGFVDGTFSRDLQLVVERGCAFDDVMNTNDTLTFEKLNGIEVNGSNS